jgi:hypothetical protein
MEYVICSKACSGVALMTRTYQSAAHEEYTERKHLANISPPGLLRHVTGALRLVD